jgi:hypothetical protein
MSPPVQEYVSNFDELSDLWEIYSDIDHFENLLTQGRLNDSLSPKPRP